MIRAIAKTGSSVIFITHDIDEVMTITDRITVLRDGGVGGWLETAKATHEEVVEAIVGRRLARLGADARIRRPRAASRSLTAEASPAERSGSAT